MRVLPADWTYFVSRSKRFEETYMPVVMALTASAVVGILGGFINLMSRFLKPSVARPLGIGLLILLGLCFRVGHWSSHVRLAQKMGSIFCTPGN